VYERHTAKLLPPRLFAWRLFKHLLAAAMFVGVSLLIGMVGYHWLGQMGWTDSFLNASMLLGGMGPLGPELPTRAAKIFAGSYALYAGLVFILSAGVIVVPVAHRLLHRLHMDEGD